MRLCILEQLHNHPPKPVAHPNQSEPPEDGPPGEGCGSARVYAFTQVSKALFAAVRPELQLLALQDAGTLIV
jgi:hypothetical protein